MQQLASLIFFFFFQAEDGIRDAQESRGLGDVYKRQAPHIVIVGAGFGGQGVCQGLQGRGRVTVVDQSNSVSIGATWHYSLAGRGDPSTTALESTLVAKAGTLLTNTRVTSLDTCLLYTSDAADEEDSVDLGGRRIIKKKKYT
eukprot:TRINITY_DN52329_c0_g1_i1.p1 TRINITY_DN52329_c0_g1~~TRINITY_DN52329_c0_g1_i1.p1  ORF type:complete len:143 (-),score=45.45 TRINITY_DN52329_c0_g1_i1:53-481(-)